MTYITKGFATPWRRAVKRSLAGVSAVVHCQCTPLNKALFAMPAFERPLIGMDSKMAVEIGLAHKALATAIVRALV